MNKKGRNFEYLKSNDSPSTLEGTGASLWKRWFVQKVNINVDHFLNHAQSKLRVQK